MGCMATPGHGKGSLRHSKTDPLPLSAAGPNSLCAVLAPTRACHPWQQAQANMTPTPMRGNKPHVVRWASLGHAAIVSMLYCYCLQGGAPGPGRPHDDYADMIFDSFAAALASEDAALRAEMCADSAFGSAWRAFGGGGALRWCLAPGLTSCLQFCSGPWSAVSVRVCNPILAIVSKRTGDKEDSLPAVL